MSQNIYNEEKIFNVRIEIVISLFIVLISLFLYSRVGTYKFIIFDDDGYVTENFHVIAGLKWESIKWAFLNIDHMCWQPLAWLSHMFDCQLYGLNSGNHHLSNVIIHNVNSLLLFFIFRKMTDRIYPSALIAALFAWHTINVDTVAWISERKNILCALFFLLTILSYYHYALKRSSFLYILSLLFYTFGLMAKPMVITLPFVLLLIDYWPINRYQTSQGNRDIKSLDITKKLLYLMIEKIPFFAITTGYLLLILFVLDHLNGPVPFEIVPLKLRIQNAIVSYISYLINCIWPHDLAVYYPFPDSVPSWKYIGAGIAIIIVSMLALKYIKKLPYLFVGWFWYLGTMFPVIGIKQEGLWPAMADRWAYIPLIGFFLILSWGLNDLILKLHHLKKYIGTAIAMYIIVIIATTWMQIGYWEDSISLFYHTARVTKNNFVAYDNLGLALVYAGRPEEAITFFKKAIEIEPRYAKSYHNIGAYYLLKNEYDIAIDYFNKSLMINPNSERVYNNLGLVMIQKGNISQAIAYFEKSLTIKPDYIRARMNLKKALEIRRKETSDAAKETQ